MLKFILKTALSIYEVYYLRLSFSVLSDISFDLQSSLQSLQLLQRPILLCNIAQIAMIAKASIAKMITTSTSLIKDTLEN